MATPAMVVRVAANIEALRRGMKDSSDTVDRTTTAIRGSTLRLVDVNRTATQSTESLTTSYRRFDGILQSLGININPYVKGLEDVMALTEGGISNLGLFGGAAAAIGVALASWKLGEKIGEVTGWTDAIARGTAVLRGYGDVAQETALAVADARDAAGHAEKMWRLQAEGTAAATRAAAEHSEEMRREGMVSAGNAATMEALANQIEKLKEKRKEDSIATFQASQAQEVYRSEAHFTTEVIVEQTNAIEERLEALAKEEAARKQATADFMNAPTLNQRVNESQTFDVTGLSQAELARTNTQFDPFGRGGDFGAQARLRQLEAAEGTYAPKSRDQYLRMLSETLELARLRMTFVPSFAGGVENFRGGMAMVGERGPELVRLPSGSDVIPNHQLGDRQVTVHVHVGGHVIGTQYQLTQLIKGALMDDLHASGFLNPSPA